MAISEVTYKRQIPVFIMIIISVIMIAEYYVVPLKPVLGDTVDTLAGWGSIIASFTTIIALFALIRQYINRIMSKADMTEYYLSIYGVIISGITVMVGLVVWSPSSSAYMNLYFNLMLPMFFAAMALNGFILMGALYRGFRAKDIYSTMMLVTCLITIITATPLLVSQYPALGSTYVWLQKVPRAAATRAFNICVGIGMIGIALRTLTGKEKALFGGE